MTKSHPQASTRETPAKVKRGFKRPGSELSDLIRIVNLVSPSDVAGDPRAMTEKEFMEWLESLSPGLKDYFLAHLNARRKQNAGLPVKLLIPFVAEHFQEIAAARDGFDGLLTHKRYRDAGEPFVRSHIPSACHLVVNDGRVEVSLSLFGRAIHGAELDYIRQCEIETCGKIFYAGRKNQHCCTVQCAKKRRQQKWRQKYGKPVLTEQEQQELAHRKTKRADPARKR